jgi:Peptidase S24-like
MDFYERIQLEKIKKKLSNKDVGRVLDMDGEAFRMAMVRKSLKPLQMKEIEKYFEIEKSENIEDKNIIGIPYYDVDFSLGFLPLENNSQTKPDYYISHPFFKGCDCVVRASGQSMAKLIAHGDAIGLIKLDNWQDFFPLGEIYAIVTVNGFRMIKIVTKGELEDTYTLISKPTDSKKEEFPPQQIKKQSILTMFKVQASSHLF